MSENWLIPADAWKKNRDRIVRRSLGHLHIVETNPGSHSFKLRFDYILTRADVAKLVEEVMAETERLARFYVERKNHVQ